MLKERDSSLRKLFVALIGSINGCYAPFYSIAMESYLCRYWLDLNALSVSSPGLSTLSPTSTAGAADLMHPTLKAAMEVEATRGQGRDQKFLSDWEQRLIDWMVEKLAELLKAIEARRQTHGRAKTQGIIPQAKASQVSQAKLLNHECIEQIMVNSIESFRPSTDRDQCIGGSFRSDFNAGVDRWNEQKRVRESGKH